MRLHSLSVSEGWTHAIDAWVLALRAAGRTQQTIETRVSHLRRFARECGATSPGLVSRARLVEWAGGQSWSRETRRSVYASLRAFFRWAVEAGQCVDDPTVNLPAIRPLPPSPRPAPEDAYRTALVRAGPREHLILRLAAEAGLRRAEIAQVSAGDVFQDLGGWSLLVHGKGERTRLVPLNDSLARELRGFLGARRWLFPAPKGGHLTPRHVGKLASRCLPDHWTLHTLRHRFATVTHEATHDLIVCQKLLGHASVATTQRYVASSQAAMRAAVRHAGT